MFVWLIVMRIPGTSLIYSWKWFKILDYIRRVHKKRPLKHEGNC